MALLPVGIFAATFLGSLMFEDGDSRNVRGVLVMLVSLVLAIPGLAAALSDLPRVGGLRAVGQAAFWAALIVGGVCGGLWVIIHFRLLRH